MLAPRPSSSSSRAISPRTRLSLAISLVLVFGLVGAITGCVGEKTITNEDIQQSDTVVPTPDVQPDVPYDTSQPDITQPDITQPDAQPDITQPDITQPDTPQPDAQPDADIPPACDPPYTGPNCGECIDGYVMNDAGTCVLDCGTCGLHEHCGELDGAPTCTCVPGYGPDNNDVCYWQSEGVNGGGLIDQNLGNAAAWTTKLIIFDESRYGSGDGAIEFDAIDTCAEASMSQTITMPSFEDAEPLVLELEYVSQADQTQYQNDLGAMLRIGGSIAKIPFSYSGSTVRVCLGANAYGGEIDLEITPELITYACESGNLTDYASRLFRRIAIVRAVPGECGAPGEFPDGTFETSTDGWEFSTTGTRTSLVNGELRMEATSGWGAVTAATSLSVPDAATIPHPAVRFDYRTTLGAADYGNSSRYDRLIDVSINGLNIARLYPNDGDPTKTAVVCLPEWTAGMAYDLMLKGNGPCNTGFPEGPLDYYSLWLDNVELVDEPGCQGLDGGFELPPERSPWFLFHTFFDPNSAWVDDPGDNGVKFDANAAHSGNGVMHFKPGGSQGHFQSRVSQTLRVPEPGAAGNPQVRFWHRADNLPPFNATFRPSTGSLSPTTSWQEVSVCINKKFAGHLVDFQWSIGANSDANVHHYWLDDITLELSAMCP